MGRTERVLKVGKISAKDDILTVQEKQRSRIGNRTKRSLEMTARKIEPEERRLKAAKMRTKKRIEKEQELLSDICGKIYWKFLQVKHQKVVKRRIMIQNDKKMKRFHYDHRLQVYMYSFMYVDPEIMIEEDYFPSTIFCCCKL